METIVIKGNLKIECEIMLTGGGNLTSLVPESDLPAEAAVIEGDVFIAGSLRGCFNILATGNIIQMGG